MHEILYRERYITGIAVQSIMFDRTRHLDTIDIEVDGEPRREKYKNN